METDESKQLAKPTPACAITSLVLFIISLVTPQFIAPLLLIVAIITGFIGFYRKEWGGTVPLITSVASIILFGLVTYNMYTISKKISDSFANISTTGQKSNLDNIFGENDIGYSTNTELVDIKGKTSYGHITINGRLKNNGSKKIKQCTIKVKIFDKKENILNTDKIIIFGDIDPAESKSFNSMALWPKGANTFNLQIEELKVKN
jgi:energy-coupling factor transporter transmembrane protein EcfT